MELRERIGPTLRPNEKPIGFQRWTNLLFLHWRVPLSAIRDLIPKSLSIDTFNGDAWIGLVPFYMSRVRPRGLPSVPWISNFYETNVRTYVHVNGKRPGVWFFSLDAARVIPILIARGKWHLNYHWSRMYRTYEHRYGSDGVGYSSVRIAKACPAMTVVSAELGEAIAPKKSQPDLNSLEFFLAERYLLYTQKRNGDLLCGQVHHSPYPLRSVVESECEQTILSANGIDCDREPDHVLFSDGVDVEIFPLRAV